MEIPKFDKKHRKKARGHIDQDIVNIAIKINTIVRQNLNYKNPVLKEKIIRYGVINMDG